MNKNITGYSVCLPDRLVNELKNIPETGMGFHIIDLKMKDGTKRYGRTIINSSELQLLCNHENIHGTDIETFIIRESGYDKT